MPAASAHFLPAKNLSAAGYLAANTNWRGLDYYRYLQQISNNQPDIDRLTLRPVISCWAQLSNNPQYRHRHQELNESFLALAPQLLGTQNSSYPDHHHDSLLASAQVSLPLIISGIAGLWAECQDCLQISAPVIDYPDDPYEPGEVFRALRVIENRHQINREYQRQQLIKIYADQQRENEFKALIDSTGWGALLNESLNNILSYSRPDIDSRVPTIDLTSAWLAAKSKQGIEVIDDQLWPRLHQLLVKQLMIISQALTKNISDSKEEPLAVD